MPAAAPPLPAADFQDLVLRAPQDAPTLQLLGVTLRTLVPGAATGGAWSLLEYTAPPRFAGPAPHLHELTGELFYVLEGELALEAGGASHRLAPGGMAMVAPGTAHRFANPADAPCRFLILVSPAGMEGYFGALAEVVRTAPAWPLPDMRPVAELGARFDTFAAALP